MGYNMVDIDPKNKKSIRFLFILFFIVSICVADL